MSLLDGVQTTNQVEKETDRLGGFQLLDSGVHPLVVELAYLLTSKGGARGLVLHFKGAAGSLRTTQYYTSGTAKGCKTFYVKDDKNYNLPGFTMVNELAAVVGLGDINGFEVEDKVLKLWSAELGQEAPTKVKVVTNLLGKEVACGVIKQIEDKSTKGDDGEYHPTGETREVNELDKVFSAENGMTALELEANANSETEVEASFLPQWKEKYEGKVINKATKSGGGGGNANAGGGATGQPKKLFS